MDGDEGFSVAVDGVANVYVTGDFLSDIVDFDPGPGIDNHTSNGEWDAFLSKFDSDGNFIWARTWGGANKDEGLSVSSNGSGAEYVTGILRIRLILIPVPLLITTCRMGVLMSF